MMFFRKKKESSDDKSEKHQIPKIDSSRKKEDEPSSGAIIADIDRLKTQFESFKEVRTAFTERFNRITEQVGELRAMLLERDRRSQELEANTLKVTELVESVHPDKLMVEIRKCDTKVELIKANLEGNEAIIKRILDELKDIRNKMSVFKGLGEVEKLEAEVKSEVINIKKIEATTNANADKVEVMFTEIKKRYRELETYKTRLDELGLIIKDVKTDFDNLKVRTADVVKRDDLDKIMRKVQKHIEKIRKKSGKSPLSKDIESLKDMLEDMKV